MVYYILHPVAGVVEEGGRAGARLPTCGAAPTYCHAGTATRAHTRASVHVRAHPERASGFRVQLVRLQRPNSAITEVANEINKW